MARSGRMTCVGMSAPVSYRMAAERCQRRLEEMKKAGLLGPAFFSIAPKRKGKLVRSSAGFGHGDGAHGNCVAVHGAFDHDGVSRVRFDLVSGSQNVDFLSGRFIQRPR